MTTNEYLQPCGRRLSGDQAGYGRCVTGITRAEGATCVVTAGTDVPWMSSREHALEYRDQVSVVLTAASKYKRCPEKLARSGQCRDHGPLPREQSMARTAIHPGQHFAEQIKVPGMSATEFGRRLKVPINRITGILNGQRAVTGDSALRLPRLQESEKSAPRRSQSRVA